MARNPLGPGSGNDIGKGPCRWFEFTHDYKGMQSIVRRSDNLSFEDLDLGLNDALTRAEQYKPSLAPHIRCVLGKMRCYKQQTPVRQSAVEKRWTVQGFLKWEWERDFLVRCSEDPKAKRAWNKLAETGLADVSKRLLWEYYTFGDMVIASICRGIKRMDHNHKALGRADRVVEERSGDPRTEMFAQRSAELAGIAARTPWPFDNPNTVTLEDAASKYPLVGRLPITPSAGSLSRHGDALRRFGPKILLATLRAGALNSSVDLSSNELAALASCANPDCFLAARSLRRFLKLPAIRAAEPAYRYLFAQGATKLSHWAR